ncbi:putative plastid-lipid-associated protein 8 [Hibiscus syriacus]|uniref:Plastid-lipid-associated protein 8 n=1 Tax=Hibiscus syriacus TaxID=106335 RepID=A0A6A2X1S7_HIBSY|nr:probable plastid-lipid-associated protein 8, chloroplastic [Hibiscus syriacus]KAE8668411.1 putative plastid-lipid-associated protein 8 [Hibiscus syriacus]
MRNWWFKATHISSLVLSSHVGNHLPAPSGSHSYHPSMAASSSFTLSSSFTRPKPSFFASKPFNLSLTHTSFPLKSQTFRVSSSAVSISSRPDDLVASILSKVTQTDGGVTLTPNQHQEVAQVANELHKYCVDEPVKCPLIFGDWGVVYCSNPTSPGGGYRSTFGRLFFKTKEMVQTVEAPDSVRNKVSFSVFGFLDGQVSLKGKLKVLDKQWIQVIFESPELRVGAMEFRYGGESEVKLQITYVDETIRLGKGSRGSLFVFRRRG